MHSVEFGPVIICYVGCGEFEGKCISSKIHKDVECWQKAEVYLTLLSAPRIGPNTLIGPDTLGIYAGFIQ